MSWLERIAEINQQDWRPVATPAYSAATLGVLIVCFFANTRECWAHLLDGGDWLTWRWWQDRELA